MSTLDSNNITSKFTHVHCGGNSEFTKNRIYHTCMLFLTAWYTKGIMQMKSSWSNQCADKLWAGCNAVHHKSALKNAESLLM